MEFELIRRAFLLTTNLGEKIIVDLKNHKQIATIVVGFLRKNVRWITLTEYTRRTVEGTEFITAAKGITDELQKLIQPEENLVLQVCFPRITIEQDLYSKIPGVFVKYNEPYKENIQILLAAYRNAEYNRQQKGV